MWYTIRLYPVYTYRCVYICIYIYIYIYTHMDISNAIITIIISILRTRRSISRGGGRRKCREAHEGWTFDDGEILYQLL